ncbi:GNAT family N-acetyltransferase [Streptomyces sp. NPDC048057]|uniref:GNAT family N-acetyltransferase n=1 Tax=Streptomyces sp. NPDC048057 TaxID=3155628 RepID=UPI0033FBEE7A
MSAEVLQRVAAFRSSFARRQAAVVEDVPGGVVVLDPQYAASYENNQLVVDGAPDPDGLPELADRVLGHLAHRRITVLDDAVGGGCAAVLVAAGYAHETELVMTYSGVVGRPDEPARTVRLGELHDAVVRQLRVWMPRAEERVVQELAGRRAARLRGADEVRFLAVRDADGVVGSWADLYLDAARGVAQIEDVVTADTHARRGYADTLLATALQHAAGCGLVFLLADPDDWPRHWYARRGFVVVGRSHVFTRAPERISRACPGPRA